MVEEESGPERIPRREGIWVSGFIEHAHPNGAETILGRTIRLDGATSGTGSSKGQQGGRGEGATSEGHGGFLGGEGFITSYGVHLHL